MTEDINADENKKFFGEEGLKRLIALIKKETDGKVDKTYVDGAIEKAVGDSMKASY